MLPVKRQIGYHRLQFLVCDYPASSFNYTYKCYAEISALSLKVKRRVCVRKVDLDECL